MKQKVKRNLKKKKVRKTQTGNCAECDGECAETGVCKYETKSKKVKKKKVKSKRV